MKLSGRYEGYTTAALRKDLISGLIVGIIAIPLGMAFAIASGVKPEYGIYTTIIAGILISLLGGSRFQIGGPTGAFVPILLAITLQYGYENLLLAGMLAGVMLVLMGLFKIGALIKFMPKPVTTGFTAGIAVIIFTGQLSNLLGLSSLEKHESFLLSMAEIGSHLGTLNVYSLIVAAVGFAGMFLSKRFIPQIPPSLSGMLLSAVVAGLLFSGQVDTIGSVYGGIPTELPHLHIPNLSWEHIGQLIYPALMIAMLGGVESLLSAVVADGMTASRHNSNRELIGQGIANIVTPLLGGIPATGAIARTAANVRSGAFSPLSGVVHSIVVLLVLLLFAKHASGIPLASMAPILMVVAWNMSERKTFLHMLKSKTSDSVVLVGTFLLTVFTNLSIAVLAGLVLSLLFFIRRMGSSFTVNRDLNLPHIGAFTVKGPLFFGDADKFERAVTDGISQTARVLLLRMEEVPFIDLSGESVLSGIMKQIRKSGGVVIISGLQAQPLRILQKTGLYGEIGGEYFFNHWDQAMDYARKKLTV